MTHYDPSDTSDPGPTGRKVPAIAIRPGWFLSIDRLGGWVKVRRVSAGEFRDEVRLETTGGVLETHGRNPIYAVSEGVSKRTLSKSVDARAIMVARDKADADRWYREGPPLRSRNRSRNPAWRSASASQWTPDADQARAMSVACPECGAKAGANCVEVVTPHPKRYAAEREKRERKSRCPHGYFYTGAGACPMCEQTGRKSRNRSRSRSRNAPRQGLRSTRPAERVGASAKRAFRRIYGNMYGSITPFYEHGHWFITTESGAQFDAVDAEGPDTEGGWGFEQVTAPDDEWSITRKGWRR